MAGQSSRSESSSHAERGAKRSAGALARPVRPDEKLAQVIGSEPRPRTEVTKRIWDYIRKNGLQDQQDKRMINADDRLAEVLDGKRKVSMFEMTKLVNKHLQA